MANDHSYAKKPSSGASMRPKPHGYTTLSVGATLPVGAGEEVASPAITPKESITNLSRSVNLLSAAYKTVGTAVTMSGTSLHGHELPAGYIKVAIQRIEPNIHSWPHLQTDEASLTSGSITAWPVKFMKNIKL